MGAHIRSAIGVQIRRTAISHLTYLIYHLRYWDAYRVALSRQVGKIAISPHLYKVSKNQGYLLLGDS